MNYTVKHCFDIGGLVVPIATIAGFLPTIFATLASLGAFVWYAVQIYDWYRKRK